MVNLKLQFKLDGKKKIYRNIITFTVCKVNNQKNGFKYWEGSDNFVFHQTFWFHFTYSEKIGARTGHTIMLVTFILRTVDSS